MQTPRGSNKSLPDIKTHITKKMLDEQIQEKLRLQYNPVGSSLRNLQIRMLEILKCIDHICKKHNIPYWLSSGTLLGAVRHGGFIPWDDDVDIELMRDDYVKLLEILPKELPKEYVLQTTYTDSGYVYLYAKIRDTHSHIEEKCIFNKHFQYNGAFIDIFPLEPTIPSLSKIASVLYNRLCLSLIKKQKIIFLYKCNLILLNKIIFPIFRLITALSTKTNIHYIYGVGFLNESRRKNEIFPLKKIVFEEHEFNAPCNNDAYLRRLYGNDYMSIPANIENHIKDTKINIW